MSFMDISFEAPASPPGLSLSLCASSGAEPGGKCGIDQLVMTRPNPRASWQVPTRETLPIALPSLAKSQPEKSEATSDNEGDPTRPHRYRPVSDGDGPLHKNPYQMEQRHHGEDHRSHKRKRFCVHAPSSQGAAVANVERTIWLPYLESNISGHPA